MLPPSFLSGPVWSGLGPESEMRREERRPKEKKSGTTTKARTFQGRTVGNLHAICGLWCCSDGRRAIDIGLITIRAYCRRGPEGGWKCELSPYSMQGPNDRFRGSGLAVGSAGMIITSRNGRIEGTRSYSSGARCVEWSDDGGGFRSMTEAGPMGRGCEGQTRWS